MKKFYTMDDVFVTGLYIDTIGNTQGGEWDLMYYKGMVYKVNTTTFKAEDFTFIQF